MLKIGDFSKLSYVSVKALRHYDDLGLLQPARIDPDSGYRYYTVDQLPRLHRILALKDLGLALEQIVHLLEHDLPAEQLRGMLRLKRAELHQEVIDAEARLTRVEARLRQIEQEDTMAPYEVIIKAVAPQRVASLRATIPTYPQQGPLWQELGTALRQAGVRPTEPCLTIYHDREYRDHDVDVEVCEPVGDTPPLPAPIRIYELPGVAHMACVIHHGPFTTINQAYEALIPWIVANGYQVAGPAREVYLRQARNGSQTDLETVTEIQFPVEPAATG